jgi:hypothetical protein
MFNVFTKVEVMFTSCNHLLYDKKDESYKMAYIVKDRNSQDKWRHANVPTAVERTQPHSYGLSKG